MKDRTDKGFDAHVKPTSMVSWSYGLGGATNFAILVPSTNHWKPGPDCYWTNSPGLGPWPAVFPTADGVVFLQFSPSAGSPGDYFHYKIVIFGNHVPDGGVGTKSQSFPAESDPDVVDTTIVWDGAVRHDLNK
jgi:hypothetical protein